MVHPVSCVVRTLKSSQLAWFASLVLQEKELERESNPIPRLGQGVRIYFPNNIVIKPYPLLISDEGDSEIILPFQSLSEGDKWGSSNSKTQFT